MVRYVVGVVSGIMLAGLVVALTSSHFAHGD
jgi:hypothetical protein